MSGAVVGFDAGTLLPVLAPAVGAAAVLVVDVVSLRLRRVHYVLALVALLVGAAATAPGLGTAAGTARRTLCLAADPGRCLYGAGAVASGLQLAALLGAAVTVLLAWPEDRHRENGRTGVTVSLILAATAGASAVAAAQDLGSWLVALELATLPTVVLVALRTTRPAVAGAIALLTTSLTSFAMLVMAAALWVTATGSAFLTPDVALAAAADPPRRAILVLSVVLALAGLGFKLSLVPFHAWTPEAYDGAPLSIAAFLAGTSKIAALAALLVIISAVAPIGAPTLTAVAILAALSMTLGNVMALRQDGVVRLLAWSTVAQAGWVVLPLAAVSTGAVRASSGYVLVYVIATLLAFAVVAALGRLWGPDRAGDLTAYRGLLREHPLLACGLALALLSLAGLPPGVLGLVAKVVALRPVVDSELWVLAVVAAANAVLGVAVYLRWLRVVVDPRPEPPATPTTTTATTPATTATTAGASGATAAVATATATTAGASGATATATATEATATGPAVATAASRVHLAVLVAVVVTFVLLVATSVSPQLVLGLLGH